MHQRLDSVNLGKMILGTSVGIALAVAVRRHASAAFDFSAIGEQVFDIVTVMALGTLGIASGSTGGWWGRLLGGMLCGALCGALGGAVIGWAAGQLSGLANHLWFMPAGMMSGLAVGVGAGGWIGARSRIG
jgi:hypothetical protein